MFNSIRFRILYWIKNSNNRNIVIISGVFFVIGAAMLLYEYSITKRAIDTTVERNSFGEGTRKEELEVETSDGSREKIEIEVNEREYTPEEIRKVFDEVIEELDDIILAGNDSADYVTNDLNLIKSYGDEPIKITWRNDCYEVLSLDGEIKKENVSEEGMLVNLSATLIYTSRNTEQAIYETSVRIFPAFENESDKEKYQIENEIKENESNSRTKESFELPAGTDDREVNFYLLPEYRGITIMVFGILLGVLLFLKEKQDKIQKKKARETQMLNDFPEILSKIIMLLGAGLVIGKAWAMVVSDYEKRKGSYGIRHGYEEMKATLIEIDNGGIEMKCFENFGKRCRLRPYLRFGSLLSQNMKKGNKGLIETLKEESYQVYDDRLIRAKRSGEEAGTKLLIPMFMMLAVALLVIIIPAFISIQI